MMENADFADFELFSYPYWNERGFIPGLGRDFPHPKRAHLYRGTFSDPSEPLCRFGWNRDAGEAFSIWRNNIGAAGICRLCIKRARRELAGGDPDPDPSKSSRSNRQGAARRSRRYRMRKAGAAIPRRKPGPRPREHPD
jgi:hypothetical protein